MNSLSKRSSSKNLHTGAPSAPAEQKAIPFITIQQRARGSQAVQFNVTDEAKAFLKELEGPLAVITVTGLYRTGKSYLLNRMLLNRKKGFGVGGSINACTKGIWIWSRPLQGYSPDGKPIKVLIMDTEGMGSLDEDSNHDIRVFSLALLLSSTFIYNSVGNIDESALQSLDLLIGVTKNIQYKASSATKNVFRRTEQDAQELAQFFPRFLWVVRDFSLQLIDASGEPISMKQYLEAALTLQKGTSEGALNKNKIRKAIMSYFKERDCVCMVRPLTDETNLQSLEELEIDDLRPQFVEQMTYLRRKVLNKTHPKEMFGKPLSGPFLAGLADAYTAAINQGAIPNIESAWTYVCQSEATKALKLATEMFMGAFERDLRNALPVGDEQLKEAVRNIKRDMLKVFREKALEAEDYEIKLRREFKKEKSRLIEENKEKAQHILKQFLTQSYQKQIERRLDQMQHFTQFQKQLRNLEDQIVRQMPEVAGKALFIEKFMKEKFEEGASYFSRKMEAELKEIKQISTENKRKLENELKEIKQDTTRERTHLRSKLTTVESEKAQVCAREQCLRENLNTMIKEKQASESRMHEEIESKDKQRERLQRELRDEIHQKEQTAKELQRQLKGAESEYLKEKALLEQKIQFMEKGREESTQKEKSLLEDLKQAKREHQNQLREVNQRFQKQVKALQDKLDQTQERGNELENTVLKVEQTYEVERQEWRMRESRLASDLGDAERELKSLSEKNKKLYESQQEAMRKLNSEKEELLAKYQRRIVETETQVKQLEEQHYQKATSWQKDIAVKKQKIEFYELQLKEITQQFSEQKKSHENLLKALQEKEFEQAAGKHEADQKLIEIVERHKMEVGQLRSELESMSERMAEQVKQLTEKNSKLELSLKMSENDSARAMAMYKEQLEESEKQRHSALEKNKELDCQKVQDQEQEQETT